MHAAFEVGVLKAILEDIRDKNQFELVGLSGTSAGALRANGLVRSRIPRLSE